MYLIALAVIGITGIALAIGPNVLAWARRRNR